MSTIIRELFLLDTHVFRFLMTFFRPPRAPVVLASTARGRGARNFVLKVSTVGLLQARWPLCAEARSSTHPKLPKSSARHFGPKVMSEQQLLLLQRELKPPSSSAPQLEHLKVAVEALARNTSLAPTTLCKDRWHCELPGCCSMPPSRRQANSMRPRCIRCCEERLLYRECSKSLQLRGPSIGSTS